MPTVTPFGGGGGGWGGPCPSGFCRRFARIFQASRRCLYFFIGFFQEFLRQLGDSLLFPEVMDLII